MYVRNEMQYMFLRMPHGAMPKEYERERERERVCVCVNEWDHVGMSVLLGTNGKETFHVMNVYVYV